MFDGPACFAGRLASPDRTDAQTNHSCQRFVHRSDSDGARRNVTPIEQVTAFPHASGKFSVPLCLRGQKIVVIFMSWCARSFTTAPEYLVGASVV